MSQPWHAMHDAKETPVLKDRLATLINSPDPGLARQGRSELEAVLKKHGSVSRTAEATGIPLRTIFRWVQVTGIEPPKEQRRAFTDAELRAAVRVGKSAADAARELGVSHTSVMRRAESLGIELVDGRALRPVRPKRQPV